MSCSELGTCYTQELPAALVGRKGGRAGFGYHWSIEGSVGAPKPADGRLDEKLLGDAEKGRSEAKATEVNVAGVWPWVSCEDNENGLALCTADKDNRIRSLWSLSW